MSLTNAPHGEKDMGTLIPLDDYAQQALTTYLEASQAELEAKATRRKARDELLAFFRLHDADTGTVDDKPVCRLVVSDREIIDTERIRHEEPFLYRRFLRLSTAYYIREVKP
jgi:hypothetical protein